MKIVCYPLLLSLAALALLSPNAVGAPPNVVIILSDDQAWTDYGFMGHEQIKTPHLDQLAKESLVFTRGYVPTSLCRPSLMTLITGLYPRQHLVTGNDPPKGTDRKEMLKHIRRVPTLPKLLVEQGYVSFQSGKWWEGNFAEGGFTAGMTHGDPSRGGRHGDEGLKIGRQGLQPIYEFLETNKGKPFFLWYAPMLPHSPHNPPERLLAKYQGQNESLHVARYHAMCEWWDETCGELLAHLDQQGLAENTIVVYVTDNGWIQDADSPKYAARSKRSPYEGGVRTPIMIRWPTKLQPRRDEQTLVSSIDLAPTILAACGLNPSPAMHGLNVLDPAALKSRNMVHGEIYEHDIVDLDQAKPNLLFRWCIAGDWKLIESADGSQRELYNLSKDPAEQNDLSAEEQMRVTALADWHSDVVTKERDKDRFRESVVRLPSLTAAIGRSKSVVLYEGLPHQSSEKALLAEELKTKEVVTLNGFPFYAEPLPLTAEDMKQLTRLLSDESFYRPWESPKFCGGYHPDYCLEWREDDGTIRTQICLGCHEIKLFYNGAEMYYDMKGEERITALSELLKRYRKNRP